MTTQALPYIPELVTIKLTTRQVEHLATCLKIVEQDCVLPLYDGHGEITAFGCRLCPGVARQRQNIAHSPRCVAVRAQALLAIVSPFDQPEQGEEQSS